MFKSDVGKETQEISNIIIGRIVSDIWRMEGVRRKRKGKRGEKPVPGYVNLAVIIDENETCSEEKTCDELVAELQTSVKNWAVVRNSKDSFSILKYETVTFNSQRSSIEILVTQSNGVFQLHLKRQQFCTTLEGLKLDEELKHLSTINQIKLIVRFLDSSSFCSGFQVRAVQNRLDLRKSCKNSVECRVGLVGEATTECRMFSAKCSIIALEGQCCAVCSVAKHNEEMKRKRKGSDPKEPKSKCLNDRYLSEEGMRRKLAYLRKKLRRCQERENSLKKKLEAQLLEREDTDHEDQTQTSSQ